jgi:hypothetical protein
LSGPHAAVRLLIASLMASSLSDLTP